MGPTTFTTTRTTDAVFSASSDYFRILVPQFFSLTGWIGFGDSKNALTASTESSCAELPPIAKNNGQQPATINTALPYHHFCHHISIGGGK